MTFNNIYKININNLYIYYQRNIKKYYEFDLRYLKQMIKYNTSINPYTNYEFSVSDLENINKRILILEKNNKINSDKKNNIINNDAKDEKDDTKDNGINILTSKQKLNSYIVETFHKIDLLGNYTDIKWFNSLTIKNLYKLYIVTHNIFYNRLPLTHQQRTKYVKNGKAFTMNIKKLIKIKSKNKLQYLILNEYNKFLNFKTDISNKKTAIIWLLLGLIEISPDARKSLRHLIPY